MRGNQSQSPAAVCGTEGELLSDHAAHRNADDVSAIPGKIIQNANGIIGHRRDGTEKWPAITLTDAEVVEVAAPVVPLQLVDLRRPNATRHPEAHDEEHRGPVLAEELVRETWSRLCPLRAHRASS